MDENTTSNQVIFTKDGLEEFIKCIKKGIPTINYDNHKITVGNLLENEQQTNPISLIDSISSKTTPSATEPRIILTINGTDTAFPLNGYSDTWDKALGTQLVTKNAILNRLISFAQTYASAVQVTAGEGEWVKADDKDYYAKTVKISGGQGFLTDQSSPIISIDLSNASTAAEVETQQEQWNKVYKCIATGTDQLEFQAFEKPDATFYIKIRL